MEENTFIVQALQSGNTCMDVKGFKNILRDSDLIFNWV